LPTLSDLLPVDAFGPWQVAVMATGLAVASLARGYSGFGFSALLVASWSLVGSPARAVAVALVMEVTASVIQAVSVWRDVPWRRVGLLIAGAVVGTPAGVYVLAVTGERALRLGIAGFIFIAAVALLMGLKLRTRATPAHVAAVGVASGVCNGAVAMGGLPVAVFLTADGASPRALRATVVAYFFLLDLTGLIFLARAGLVTGETFGLAAMSLPVLIVGMWLGAKHFLGATPEGFRRATLVLLIGLAVLGIVKTLA
jgi:uncharacterized protein